MTDSAVTYGVSFVDVDYDNDLDIFTTNIARTDRNMLYLNDGRGRFTKADLAISQKSDRPSKGHTWGDFNNDGYLDLFVANGTMNVTKEKIRNMLYFGKRKGDFSEVKDWVITKTEGTSAGTAWADFDRDGDLDIYISNWADNNEDNEFFRNDLFPNRNWIELQLRGSKSNRMGLGCWIRIKVKHADGSSFWQTRYMSDNTGYSSQNEPIVHFGLDQNKSIDILEVHWPSGIVDRFKNLAANQFYNVEEGGSIRPFNLDLK